MQQIQKTARQEAKNLIINIGWRNLKNEHVNEVVNRTGVSYLDMQNALNYFEFSRSQAKFRELYML